MTDQTEKVVLLTAEMAHGVARYGVLPTGLLPEGVLDALEAIASSRAVVSDAGEKSVPELVLSLALSRMIDMIDFHLRDGYLPQNEVTVPMEVARAALAGDWQAAVRAHTCLPFDAAIKKLRATRSPT